MTLVFEQIQQIEAHQIILAACSQFFSTVLKSNKRSHLIAIVDFIYHREANVDQEDLDKFLARSQELQLEGLAGN